MNADRTSATPNRLFTLFNVVWFQVIWILAVAYQMKFIYLVAALVVLHFFVTSTPKRDLFIMLVGVVIGCLIDNLLTANKVFVFSDQPSIGLIPVWLVILWAAFAISTYHSLSIWIKSRAVQILIGAVAGPISYLAGRHFDAVTFSFSTLVTFIILAIVWAILLPILIELSNYFRHAKSNKHA
ncbi:DUF2878 domain-containing protein [Alteromonas ponticola]|uniref:DUF2878 domain-containing protein n=1 Tax=Alteromonas ponticola TaxID=2720613 RepID=A0ABX1QXZ9_9ALTE|nr:DUF2878 domain-containing protein [Alteromonas ponticola]NMH58571.1 DUF2878 domain-containing protein [Alteromonas ponticola]